MQLPKASSLLTASNAELKGESKQKNFYEKESYALKVHSAS